MRFNNFAKLLVAVGVAEAAGVVGAFFTTPAISSGWYTGLMKPALNPPAWVFGPAWTTLYALMGISLFLVWRAGWKKKEIRTGIGVFGVQLVLNAAWSVIFFGFKSPGWALVNIAALWFAIVWTMAVFYKISRPAVWLLVPYLLWVSFASYLNYSIWALNREERRTETIQLYYYNPELDKDDSGNIACSRKGLAAVTREVPVTRTPIQDAIKTLLLGNLTAREREQGIDTEYPLEGLSLKGVLMKDGVATLEFDDPKNKTVGGSCRVSVLWHQIEATARQFPEVQQVRFLPEEIFQP